MRTAIHNTEEYWKMAETIKELRTSMDRVNLADAMEHRSLLQALQKLRELNDKAFDLYTDMRIYEAREGYIPLNLNRTPKETP